MPPQALSEPGLLVLGVPQQGLFALALTLATYGTGAQLFSGRMYDLPTISNLMRGCDCYCRVPGLELPPGSHLVGHPCEVIEIDTITRPWAPYRVAIKEGKHDRLISLPRKAPLTCVC